MLYRSFCFHIHCCAFSYVLLFQKSPLMSYSAWVPSGVVAQDFKGEHQPPIGCTWGCLLCSAISWFASKQNVEIRGMYTRKVVTGEQGMGLQGTGWEQESAMSDKRGLRKQTVPQQQRRTSGAEQMLGKASRGHRCPRTCLSGTSVSPPHPCIQSPLLTGTRKGGMSVVRRAEPGLTCLPLG